jgi:hypothetical protein
MSARAVEVSDQDIHSNKGRLGRKCIGSFECVSCVCTGQELVGTKLDIFKEHNPRNWRSNGRAAFSGLRSQELAVVLRCSPSSFVTGSAATASTTLNS